MNEIHPTLDFSLFTEQPENTNEKITFICHEKDERGNEHGEFTKTLHGLLGGQGCPVCGRIQAGLKIRLTQNEFINRVKEVHKLKNWDLSECVYNKGSEEVTVICNETDSNGVKHGNFRIKAVNLLMGNGCPKCSTSHLEQRVRVFFNEKVKLEGQQRFDWLGMQSLDFYSEDYKIGIECQGSQHFKADFFISKGIEYANKLLKEVQERDKRKKQLCKENGVKLIYFLDKKFEKYMKDDDIYFTDLQEMLEYIIKQPKK